MDFTPWSPVLLDIIASSAFGGEWLIATWGNESILIILMFDELVN